MREGSGVWIRHSKCEIHTGHQLVMQASRGEFWAKEGDQGCLNLPGRVYMFLCLCSAGPALPPPLRDPGLWATRACCLGHPPHPAMTAGEAGGAWVGALLKGRGCKSGAAEDPSFGFPFRGSFRPAFRTHPDSPSPSSEPSLPGAPGPSVLLP